MVSLSQATGMGVFVLVLVVQLQLFSIEQPASNLKFKPHRHLVKDPRRMVWVSPLQGACVSLLTMNSNFKPATQAVLLSGTFYRVIGRELTACIRGKRCDPAAALDFSALWAASDATPLVAAFDHAFKTNSRWAAMACSLLAIGAFSLMFSPGKGLLGAVGVAQLCYCNLVQEATCSLLWPQLVLVALLTLHASVAEALGMRRDKAAKKEARAQEDAASGLPLPPSPGPSRKKSRIARA